MRLDGQYLRRTCLHHELTGTILLVFLKSYRRSATRQGICLGWRQRHQIPGSNASVAPQTDSYSLPLRLRSSSSLRALLIYLDPTHSKCLTTTSISSAAAYTAVRTLSTQDTPSRLTYAIPLAFSISSFPISLVTPVCATSPVIGAIVVSFMNPSAPTVLFQ